MVKTIQRVLLCKPTHYSVEYIINPWMEPGSVDTSKAMDQWRSLVQVYKSLGIQVDVIDQVEGQPDMVFAADQGIVQGNQVLLSNFRCKERQGESRHYAQWFKENKFELLEIKRNEYFEGGGECLPWKDIYFIGTGFRSIHSSIHYMEKKLKKKIVELELINERFYHLDTCLFPINNEIVFYYEKGFSKKSLIVLKKMIPHFVAMTDEEATAFCSNSIVTGNKVVCHKSPSTFKEKLKVYGYETIELDVSEFLKAGGGVHCLTNILAYK